MSGGCGLHRPPSGPRLLLLAAAPLTLVALLVAVVWRLVRRGGAP